nr:DUF6512 family protein [uncultured Acetatifactor sp.]
MKTLRRYTVIGILFVMLTGTLAHFLYDWSGRHAVVGLFSPVNESVWEHMKLLFFPMLLYSLFLIGRLKGDFPCLPSSLWAGLLAGTLAIPLLYYGYTFILGRDLFLLDLGTFLLSVLIAFRIACRLALSGESPMAFCWAALSASFWPASCGSPITRRRPGSSRIPPPGRRLFSRLSFLCKDREEKCKEMSYNDKDTFKSAKHHTYEEVSHGMGRKIKPKHGLY